MIGNRRQAHLGVIGQAAGPGAVEPEIAKDLDRGFNQARAGLRTARDVSVRLRGFGDREHAARFHQKKIERSF